VRVEQHTPLITVLVDGEPVLTGQVRDPAVLDLVRRPRDRRVWVPLVVVLVALVVLGVAGAVLGVVQ
jgi:hypothetical protein